VSETTWHCFANVAFSGKFAFPICEHSVWRDWQAHLKKPFVYMATTSCMSVAVSNFGAEWLLEGTYYATF